MYQDLYEWFQQGRLYLKCLQDVYIEEELEFVADNEYEVADVYLIYDQTDCVDNIMFKIGIGQSDSYRYCVPFLTDDFELVIKGN